MEESTTGSIRRDDLIEIRGYSTRDYKYVHSCWLDGLYFGNHVFAEIPEYIFRSKYKEIIDHVLDKPTTEVNIACLKDETSVILGFAVSSQNHDHSILHWVYVKPAWRKIGIARDLVPKNTQLATHITQIGAAIMRKKQLIFDPFSLDL